MPQGQVLSGWSIRLDGSFIMNEEQFALTPHTIEAIREGQYTLLLGAGASLGAMSRNRQSLPSGATFAQEIVQGLGLDISPDTPLAYVWDAAVHKSGSERALREKFCSPRFLGCKPAAYHHRIPSFAWKRIYTFNVDDVIPQAYNTTPAGLQHSVPIHFDDDYREADQIADECQVVYLHGSELFPDRPLVFGPPAYAAAVTRQHTWWHVFASSFLSEPYIVIGASLREPDFESYLAWKRRPLLPLAAPSLYVSPSIDDAVRAICNRLGLTPVEMSGDDFLERLDAAVDQRAKISIRRAHSLQGLALLSTIKAIPALATLARQFVVVNDRTNWPTLNRPPERFFEGYSPSWSDLQTSHDVQLQISARIVDHVRRFFLPTAGAKALDLLCIEGTAGSGKTTVLMRSAVGISDIGIDTLFFSGQNRLPVAVLADVAKGLARGTGFVVVIDDVDAHVHQLRQFIEIYPSAAGRCIVLCAVRSGRRRFFEQNLSDLLDPRFELVSPLTSAEASELADKLRAAAKLGRFAGWTEAQLVAQFTSTKPSGWGGQILTILLQVVTGGVLHERLRTEWKSLQSDDIKAFYGAICIAAACGVPVRLGVAFRTISQTTDSKTALSELTTGSMRGLVELFRVEFARPRHRVVAEETVHRCMDRNELFHIAGRLTLALAPYVNRQTIIARTPEALLARQLMDTDGPVVPVLADRAEEWFATFEADWGWNSRYWEQRALAALKAEHYSRARDFAEQAVGIEYHPMPMTTCALVNLASIEHDESLGRSQCDELFLQSIELLDTAIRRSSQRHFNSFHSYHVLFLHSVRVAHKLTGELPKALREKLEFHGAQAERLFARDSDTGQAVEKLKTKDGLIWRS